MNDSKFTLLQGDYHKRMIKIWKKAREGSLKGMNEEERLIADIMLEHRNEFQEQFDAPMVIEGDEAFLDDYIDPFFHVGLHAIIERQLAEKTPAQVRQFYSAVTKKKCSHHQAIHLIAIPLSFGIFDAYRNDEVFDEEWYCDILRKYRNRKPETIQDLIEEEIDRCMDLYADETFMEDLFSFEEVPLAHAKKELEELVDHVGQGGKPLKITSRRGHQALLISTEMVSMLEDFKNLLSQDSEPKISSKNGNVIPFPGVAFPPETDGAKTAAKTKPLPLSKTFKEVYQFKITLKGTKPPIWRRIQVPADYTFWDFHVAIQDAMGWRDNHLHEFTVWNPKTHFEDEIGVPLEDDWEVTTIAGWLQRISDYFSLEFPRAVYVYDFGDDWQHAIQLEAILPRAAEIQYPHCLKGRRACPPEDCGGIWAYKDLCEILQNPSHGEYANTIEWLEGVYDPGVFNCDAVRFDDPRKRWKTALR